MADDLSTLVFTAASSAVITKGHGIAIIGFRIPASVDNSAVRMGFEVSFDSGVTYSVLATDVAGTATPYKPKWAAGQFVVLDPTVIYALEGATNVRVTLYATNGTTAASQTSTSLGVLYATLTRG